MARQLARTSSRPPGPRAWVVAIAAVALVGGLAGCTETIAGAGHAGAGPTLSGGGDFPSGSPTASGSDTPSASESPTGSPSGSETPTDTGTPSGTSSTGDVQTLCSDLDDAASLGEPDGSADLAKSYASLSILTWGFTINADDPWSVVDGVTEAACPDSRTAVLKATGLPDLASTKSS